MFAELLLCRRDCVPWWSHKLSLICAEQTRNVSSVLECRDAFSLDTLVILLRHAQGTKCVCCCIRDCVVPWWSHKHPLICAEQTRNVSSVLECRDAFSLDTLVILLRHAQGTKCVCCCRWDCVVPWWSHKHSQIFAEQTRNVSVLEYRERGSGICCYMVRGSLGRSLRAPRRSLARSQLQVLDQNVC